MPEKDSRVDTYVEKAAPFAKPILIKLRSLIFKACPDARETIKWSFPSYEVHGSILCNVAAFKAHCALGFWKASLMKDPEGILHVADKNSMGHLDKLVSVKDLPSDAVLISYIREAALLNKNKIKVDRPKAEPKPEAELPPDLKLALKKNKQAWTFFESFTPSQRREYVEWVNEAKTKETRDKRITTIVEWVSEGKTRLWKYKKT